MAENESKKATERALIDYSSYGKVDKVRSILEENPDINVNVKNANGWTPLMRACMGNHVQVAIELMKNEKLDINEKNQNQKTAFYIACKYRASEVVKLMLIRDDLDVNCTSFNGWTGLMYASYCGYLEIVQAVLGSKFSVEVDTQNMYGKTAIDYAREYHQNETVELLESFLRDPIKVKMELRILLGHAGKKFFNFFAFNFFLLL